MTFTLIREYYKNNKIIIFKKTDITIVGYFVYIISAVLFIYDAVDAVVLSLNHTIL